jgi:hypothetical protein
LEIGVGLVAIVLAFAAVHGRRVADNFGEYQWEDRKFIRHNQVYVHSVGDCFTQRPLWNGLYRPLTTNLYYYLGRQLFDNRIQVHHAINIIFYLLNGFLLFWICRRFLPGYWAMAPPVMWVSRFAHVEVVCNSCEFQALLAAFFVLSSLGLFVAARVKARVGLMVLSVVFFGLALLSKETSVVLPGILIGLALLFEKRSAWKHYLWHAAVVAVWIVLFIAVLKGVTDAKPTGFLYDFSPANLSVNLGGYMLVFLNLLTHSLDSVVMVSGVAAMAENWFMRVAVLGLGLISSLYAVFHRRWKGKFHVSAQLITFGLLFFFCAAAPYVILEGRLFMRYSYLPHAGLAIVAGVVLREVAWLVCGLTNCKIFQRVL